MRCDFYGVTLSAAAIPERIPYAREPLKLPVVLSADEVVQFLETVSSQKSRAAPANSLTEFLLCRADPACCMFRAEGVWSLVRARGDSALVHKE